MFQQYNRSETYFRPAERGRVVTRYKQLLLKLLDSIDPQHFSFQKLSKYVVFIALYRFLVENSGNKIHNKIFRDFVFSFNNSKLTEERKIAAFVARW